MHLAIHCTTVIFTEARPRPEKLASAFRKNDEGTHSQENLLPVNRHRFDEVSVQTRWRDDVASF